MPESNYTAGQPINLGLNGWRDTAKRNGRTNSDIRSAKKWKGLTKILVTLGLAGVLSWYGAGHIKDYLARRNVNDSITSYKAEETQILETSVPEEIEKVVESIFKYKPDPLSKISENNFNSNNLVTPGATELVDNNGTVKDTQISSDATECDLESRISMYPYPINQDFIDSISNIDSDSKIINLYADIVKQFPRACSAAFDASKRSGIDPSLNLAFLIIEGGFQIAYNSGESDSEIERTIGNSLGYNTRGPFQITHTTWQQYGDGFSWDDMYKYGPSAVVFTKVLKHYMEIVGNDFVAGILAYNMGPYGVKQLIKEELDGDSSKLLDFVYKVSQYKDGYDGKSQRYWIEKAKFFKTIFLVAFQLKQLLIEAGLDMPGSIFGDYITQAYLSKIPNIDTLNNNVPGYGTVFGMYKVVKGDSLSKISKNLNTGVEVLRALNTLPKNNNTIYPGQVLFYYLR